jgi:transposase
MPSGGSHPKKAQSVRDLVAYELALGMTPSEIVRAHPGTSPSFVTQEKKRQAAKALGLDEYAAVRGRPRALHAAALQSIVDFLEDFPTAYHDEICDMLEDEHEIRVSRATIGRYLDDLKITHKRVSPVNIRRDLDLVAHFLARMMEYTPDQIVALDESAANERTGDRKYGWAPRGQACRVRESYRRTTRWSILPALTVEGWLDWETFHGSFDEERFFEFVERVVEEKMNPFPAPRSVLLLDNASIHHSERFQTFCEMRGIKIEYLPPYSPHLNPIEMAFHELKEWMRRHRALAVQFEDDFEIFIRAAMADVCKPSTARAYFRECGYGDEA